LGCHAVCASAPTQRLALTPLKRTELYNNRPPNSQQDHPNMSFPYALLHFEAQQAKQRLTQVFHAAPVTKEELNGDKR
jgi:hypothetical protein